MPKTLSCLCVLLAATAAVANPPAEAFVRTVAGAGEATPAGYVPPLLSNGSVCLQLDPWGGQRQQPYCRMTPAIWWAGRRYGPPRDALVPFGHFQPAVWVAGKPLPPPTQWEQSLDVRRAVVACRNEHQGLSVETTALVALGRDAIAVRRRVTAADAAPAAAELRFRYQFTAAGIDDRPPRRVVCRSAWNAAAEAAEFHFDLDGHRPARGIVAVFADRPVEAKVERQTVTLVAPVELRRGQPVERTFFIVFADSLDGADVEQRIAAARDGLRRLGFEGLLAEHGGDWARYWDQSYVQVPNERLARAYATAQYHLRANATQWSFPVGIFPTHWQAKFFGWDEMFCHQALASSNHLDVAVRTPRFRRAGLKIALDRNGHYGKPGTYGARYPWEAMEDGNEGAIPGFWIDHVFHMSNIAQSAWLQYQYTADRDYLEQTAYPVMKECARFFVASMVYELPDGRTIIGKCTDLERLGPAKLNPFMTASGAIVTLQTAAAAAALLEADADEAARWQRTAAGLLASLPQAGGRYVPYSGCADESIASLGGLFPYPLFDEHSAPQRNAAYHYLRHGRQFGNMYPMGQGVCGWYLGWMAAALARLGDKVEPARLLDEAAAGAGLFGEMFEINEPKLARVPWFSTASGNVVYALNQMLLECRDDELRLGRGVPAEWKDYSFKLAAYGDLVVEAAVRDGRLAKLVLQPGKPDASGRRTLVLPKSLAPAGLPGAAATAAGDNVRWVVNFSGRTVVVAP